MQLVLASSSRHRRKQLNRLGLVFETISPDVDETPLAGESPARLAARLAEAKARAVAARIAGTESRSPVLIVGSDQTAALDETYLTKPGTATRAVAQLQRLSGRRVTFHTGLCLLNATTGGMQLSVEDFTVTFRSLRNEEIEDYVRRDQPLDSAGSFRSEGLGIALFSRLDGTDPNSLVGLPLIRLVEFLGNEGVDVLGAATGHA